MGSPRADSQEEADDARRQLLNRILASKEFAHAHILTRILRYLCEKSLTPGQPSPKEYEIAVYAMGRPVSFDPRIDPIVRVSISSIRDRLLAYFTTEGKAERLRVQIPKGQYLPIFSRAGPDDQAEAEKPARALAEFWRPYLSGPHPNIIVYTEPLFFRDNNGLYIRHWAVNDRINGPLELKERFPLPEIGQMEPSFHYLSAGEVHCVLSLSRMFHEIGAPVETRNSRISSWNELRSANLILLGSPRTNTFLASLQGQEDFTIDTKSIRNRQPAAGEMDSYSGHRYLDGKLMRMTEYAVVTRRPGLVPGSAVTIISANHGRAIEGAGHSLTLEDRLRQVIAPLTEGSEGRLPESFQLLMQVDTIDVDDEVAQVQCIARRPC